MKVKVVFGHDEMLKVPAPLNLPGAQASARYPEHGYTCAGAAGLLGTGLRPERDLRSGVGRPLAFPGPVLHGCFENIYQIGCQAKDR